MVIRQFWVNRIEEAWKHRSLVWLRGVRRSGKTVLCQGLSGVEYFDCEIPRVRQSMEDPEFFLTQLKGRRVVLDEVHRLQNPSELLKIATDHFPDIKIVATGSSSLQASRKFRDTLTGRKWTVDLTPMNQQDGQDFSEKNLIFRLLRGGLPPFFLSSDVHEIHFQEWMDSYWARDIQELFRLERRASFQKCVELAFVRSGGIFEATAFAGPCEISRPTVSHYLRVMEDTRVCTVVRPFSARRSGEIVSAPKVYGFDTGFVSYYRGWDTSSPEVNGVLWEHYVLNELLSLESVGSVHYWRDKQGHDVDFVLAHRGKAWRAIECKWSWRSADLKGLVTFRKRHPGGENWVVAPDVTRPFERKEKGLVVSYMNLSDAHSQLLRRKAP